MKTKPWHVLWLLSFLSFAASGNDMEATAHPNEPPPLVSLCDILKQPSVYAGKTVRVTVHVAPFKDASRIWSPSCSDLGVSPRLDREPTEENGLAAYRKAFNRQRTFIATLTGIYDADYFDPIRHVKHPVFRVLAAKDIERAAKR